MDRGLEGDSRDAGTSLKQVDAQCPALPDASVWIYSSTRTLGATTKVFLACHSFDRPRALSCSRQEDFRSASSEMGLILTS